MKHPLSLLADAVPGAMLASFFFQDGSWITVSVGGVVSVYVLRWNGVRRKYLPHLTDFGLLVGGAGYAFAQRRGVTPSNSLVIAGAATLLSSFFVSDDITRAPKMNTLHPNQLPTAESGNTFRDIRLGGGLGLVGNQPEDLQRQRRDFLWSDVYNQGHL